MRALCSLLLVPLLIGAASASDLTLRDVQTLLQMQATAPGTVRIVGDRGRHVLLRVTVSGRVVRGVGHWRVDVEERALP